MTGHMSIITSAGAGATPGLEGMINNYASLGFGALVIIIVGRSIYNLVGQWKSLADEARKREISSQDELAKLRSALAAEQITVATLKAELKSERAARAEAEETMQAQIETMQAEITELRRRLDG